MLLAKYLLWAAWENILASHSHSNPILLCSPNKRCSLWERLDCIAVCVAAFSALPFWQDLRTFNLPPSLPPSITARTCVVLHFFVLHCDLITGECLREICHQCLHPLIPAWMWCTPSGQCQANVSSAHLIVSYPSRAMLWYNWSILVYLYWVFLHCWPQTWFCYDW